MNENGARKNVTMPPCAPAEGQPEVQRVRGRPQLHLVQGWRRHEGLAASTSIRGGVHKRLRRERRGRRRTGGGGGHAREARGRTDRLRRLRRPREEERGARRRRRRARPGGGTVRLGPRLMAAPAGCSMARCDPILPLYYPYTILSAPRRRTPCRPPAASAGPRRRSGHAPRGGARGPPPTPARARSHHHHAL
jgi:hypothetical protein